MDPTAETDDFSTLDWSLFSEEESKEMNIARGELEKAKEKGVDAVRLVKEEKRNSKKSSS